MTILLHGLGKRLLDKLEAVNRALKALGNQNPITDASSFWCEKRAQVRRRDPRPGWVVCIDLGDGSIDPSNFFVEVFDDGDVYVPKLI